MHMIDLHTYSSLLGIRLIYTLTPPLLVMIDLHTYSPIVRHMIDLHTYSPLLGI